VAGERILVVDDEPGVRAALEQILSDEGYRVRAVESAEAALAAVGEESFDAILLDVWLPGIDGIEALRQLADRRGDAEVVMISGHGNIETAVRATRLGAFDFIEKPLSLEKTLLVLRNALRQRRLEQRNRHLLAQLTRRTEIAGNSVAACRLREAVEIAAAAEAPVLISGEPGSGRESVARLIHSSGPRAEGPFVEVPCGALAGPAAREALLGDEDRPGRIVLAAGGSLFLEDVDKLDPALQGPLASRLGAEARSRTPARWLSSAVEPATIATGLRRRLDVIRVAVPSLRERREDIPLLVERFMSGAAREYGREPKPLSSECWAVLRAHDWPGNLAELENVVERLLLQSSGTSVERADLPQELGGRAPAPEDLYREFGSLAEGLQAFERYYLRRVMATVQGDVAAAARRLRLPRAELERRLAAARETDSA
jgi:two-component system nitrogen regulation response regulator NtrX